MPSSAPLSFLDAAEALLRQRGEPTHYRTLTDEALSRGMVATAGKTPAASLRGQISAENKRRAQRGAFPRFTTLGRGLIGLSAWENSPDSSPAPADAQEPRAAGLVASRRMTFLDAAAEILSTVGHPLHYRDITAQALERGLIQTSGLTPAATMRAQISQENRRRARRGERPRFDALGRGLIGLPSRQESSPIAQVEAHNRGIRDALRAQLGEIDPRAFETLIGELLGSMGFDDVEVTRYHGDGGIDVTGHLSIAGVIRIRMAVQVKRQQANVRAPVVRDVRGSLGAHDHGMVVTTSGFSPGARQEAARADAHPISLMDGEQLVGLLAEHRIGVSRVPIEVLSLTGYSFSGQADSDDESLDETG